MLFRSRIEVKPSYGLTDTEIETMLKASMEHASEDMEARRLREQQVEADRVLEALQAALDEDGARFLDAAERAAIDAAAVALATARKGTDHRAIKRAIEAVEKAGEAFVERRMNANIQRMMAGHEVKDFE